MTSQVLATLVATSLAACGGGGAGTGSDSVSASLVVSKPSAAAAPAASTPASVSTTLATPAADTPAVASPVSTDTTTITTAAADSTPAVATALDTRTSSPAAMTPAAPIAAVSTTASTPAPVTTTTISAPAVTAALAPTPVSAPAVAAAQAPTTTTAATAATSTSASAYGTYLRPYAVNSLWNSRPVNPVFGTFVIPTSSYFPAVQSGAYSTGVFLASSTDLPMTVVGSGSTATATNGVSDPDSAGSHVITIPRWPAGVLPASGSDGHADIVDPVTNIIHSFWQLKQVNGRWTAALYSWSSLTGTGWGDPAHFYQGARAVGIPASAGLIRKQEIKDGSATYPHALAMSLTYNALSNGTSAPAYVFPATSADNSASANTGSIPEGALMMLPPSFDSSKIVNADLKKVVETLKLYGAYVVDRNTGTPFVIYAENDSGFNLMPKGWDNTIASQLDQIRGSLRQVVSAPGWVDGDGNSAVDAIKAQQTMNVLSMRGGWYRQSGTATAAYDTYLQSLVFSATTTKTVFTSTNNNGLTPVKWALPKAGAYFNFTVNATGGAKLRLQVNSNGASNFDTWDLANGESMRILWPANASIVLIATSGTSGVSSVKADLVPSP